MAVLSLFTDEILYISSMKDIFGTAKKCSVKYSDNKKYAARVLAICNDESILLKVKSHIESGATKDIQDDLISMGPSEMTFSEVSKIIENTDEAPQFIQLKKRRTDDHHLSPSAKKEDSAENRRNREKEIPLLMLTDLSDICQDDPRFRWTEEQRQVVLSAFGHNLEAGTIPSGAEMTHIIHPFACMKERTVPQLRSWLHAQKKKMGQAKKQKESASTSEIYVADSSDSYDSHSGSENTDGTLVDISNTIPVDSRFQWSEEERLVALKAFKKKLKDGKMPTGFAMKRLIESNECLQKRTVAQLRSWLHQQKKKMKRRKSVKSSGGLRREEDFKDRKDIKPMNNSEETKQYCAPIHQESSPDEPPQLSEMEAKSSAENVNTNTSLMDDVDKEMKTPLSMPTELNNTFQGNVDIQGTEENQDSNYNCQEKLISTFEDEEPKVLEWEEESTEKNNNNNTSSTNYENSQVEISSSTPINSTNRSQVSENPEVENPDEEISINISTVDPETNREKFPSSPISVGLNDTYQVHVNTCIEEEQVSNHKNEENHLLLSEDKASLFSELKRKKPGEENSVITSPVDHENCKENFSSLPLPTNVNNTPEIDDNCVKQLNDYLLEKEYSSTTGVVIVNHSSTDDSITDEKNMSSGAEEKSNLEGIFMSDIDGTIIITPSATLNYDDDITARQNLNETYLVDPDKIELASNDAYPCGLTNDADASGLGETISDTTSKIADENSEKIFLDVQHHENGEDSNEGLKMSIDPFKFNVFSDGIPPSNEPPKSSSFVVKNEERKSFPKRIPKIISVEKVNHPYTIRCRNEQLKTSGHNKSLTRTANHNQGFGPPIDDGELGQPLWNSTMEKPEMPSEYAELDDDKKMMISRVGSEKDAEDSDQSGDSDDNYRPDEESSEESEPSHLGLDEEDRRKGSEQNKSGDVKSLDNTFGEDIPTAAPDDRTLNIQTASATTTKKHFCLYCKTLQSKLARHLENVHSKEENVKKFTCLPPRSKEPQDIITTLRKNGDYMYNTNRLYNKRHLLLCRRPNARMQKTAEDFVVCGQCKGQYSRSAFRHHYRKCAQSSGKYDRGFLVKSRKISGRVHAKASKMAQKFLWPYMREDEVVRGIRYDELITIYANKQCEKYSTHRHLFVMVRQRLRLLGRFLIAIKDIDKRITQFSEVFQPRYYDSVIAAVRDVAGYHAEQGTFDTPANASNLGTLIKHVGEALRSEYIKSEQEEEKSRVDNFLKLLAEDYTTSINRMVAETQTQNNRRKIATLPSNDDVNKFYTFVKSEREKFYSELTEKYSFEAWNHLGKMTLISLQIFNRRRPGEIERLYLEDFHSHKGVDSIGDKDTYASLSNEGKKLAREYVRFEIRGKLGRGVPVLVASHVLKCLNLLIEHRGRAGVPSDNLYLFGLPSNDKNRHRYHRACELMREYSEKCGAEIPSSLRGTKLRKHIATRCIQFNLSDNQVTDLANFVGHHEKIHKEIYRQPVLETDIVKISKILKIAQGCDESDDSGDEGEAGPSTSNQNTPNSSRDYSNAELSTSSTPFIKRPQTDTSTPKRWSDDEPRIVLSAFRELLVDGKMPSGIEMQRFINSQSCLRGRTVPQLRTWLHTQKKKMSKV